ncbi:MAG TPA: uroporphyrinogen decarboxylase family protein [Clostridiales bacterium]|nr:uroporphyrinogen decarboxylase family protein [Clostridiales bacterium]
MKRNMKTWIYNLLNSPDRKAMPILSFPGAEMKSINIIQVVNEAKAQYECIKAITEKYPSIANVACMDLSVEAQAFGCEIKFVENEVPTVIKGAINDIEEVEELNVPEIGAGRTLEYIKAVELAAKNLKERPTLAGMIGPFSLAGRLFDMTEIMVNIMVEPDGMKLLLEKTTQFLIEYAKAFKNAGANGIIIAEPAAGLLSPQHCHEFSSEYVRKIVEAVQDEFFMAILHNCGNTENQVESMVSTGAMGLHFGNAVDMARIMPKIPWGRVAMGNVDPAGVMKNGSIDEVLKKTGELLWETAIYKNFVLSTGCDVPPGTPQSNIQAFFEELESFNSSVMAGETA